MPNNALFIFNMKHEQAIWAYEQKHGVQEVYVSGIEEVLAESDNLPVYDSIRGNGPYNFEGIPDKFYAANQRDMMTHTAQINAAHVEPAELPTIERAVGKFPVTQSTNHSLPWYKQFTPSKRALMMLAPRLAEKPEAGGGRNKRMHAYTIIRDEENCESFGYYTPDTTNKAAEDGEREFGKCDPPAFFKDLFAEA